MRSESCPTSFAWCATSSPTAQLSFGVRAALVGLLAWLVNPIDLIPEFIPVLGPLDDVVVAVLVLRYVRRRIGEDAMRARWRGSAESFDLLGSIIGSGRPMASRLAAA
jgi:uncharacterized membrane protein YkvA (DUF1232 family)